MRVSLKRIHEVSRKPCCDGPFLPKALYPRRCIGDPAESGTDSRDKSCEKGFTHEWLRDFQDRKECRPPRPYLAATVWYHFQR